MITLEHQKQMDACEQRLYRLPDGTQWNCYRCPRIVEWGLFSAETHTWLTGHLILDDAEAQAFWELLVANPEAAWATLIL